jgi:hypothetical protein
MRQNPDVARLPAPPETRSARKLGLLDIWEYEVLDGYEDRLEIVPFLDARLRVSARSRAVTDLFLGRILHKLHQKGREIDLGFSSIDDYAKERLGIGRRSAQTLRQLTRLAERSPAVSRAVARGALSPRKAVTLGPVLGRVSAEPTPEPETGSETETEAAWIQLAQDVSVRELQALVRQSVEEATGNETTGNETTGNEATGNETTGADRADAGSAARPRVPAVPPPGTVGLEGPQGDECSGRGDGLLRARARITSKDRGRRGAILSRSEEGEYIKAPITNYLIVQGADPSRLAALLIG